MLEKLFHTVFIKSEPCYCCGSFRVPQGERHASSTAPRNALSQEEQAGGEAYPGSVACPFG